MTFAAVMLWIKTFLSSVPRSVYTHGLAFFVGVVLRGCLAVAPVLLLAGPAPAQPCPVNGSNCTCGCQSGKPCNCAISHVAVERLSRLDPQALAYRDLCEWAERHPHMTVLVYVRVDAPPNKDAYLRGCRYDAGWPDIKTPTIIYAMYADGKFIERFRRPGAAHAVQYRPVFQPFSGNCSGGR